MDIQTDDTKRKCFLWGVCLAWTPFLFFIPTMTSAFNGIAREQGNWFGSSRWRFGAVLLDFRTGCHSSIRSGGDNPVVAHILRHTPSAGSLLSDLHLLQRIRVNDRNPFLSIVVRSPVPSLNWRLASVVSGSKKRRLAATAPKLSNLIDLLSPDLTATPKNLSLPSTPVPAAE